MERDNRVDIAKGIGILLMVIGHFNIFFAYASLPIILIYGFHMPLFVFLSGRTLRYSMERKYKDTRFLFFKDKYNSIVVPYIVVSFLSMLITILLNGYIQTGWFYTMIKGEAIDTDFSYNLPLWFLPMLFVALSVFYITYKLVRNVAVQGCVSVILTCIGYYMMRRCNIYIWNVDVALFLQVFVFTGYYYSDIEKKCEKYNINKYIVLILCSVIYLVSAISNSRVDLNGRYVSNVVLFFISSITGITGTLLLSEILSKVKVLSGLFSILGKNSIAILSWHIPLTSVFYSSFIPVLPRWLESVARGGQGRIIDIVLAIILNLIVVLPASIALHKIVFKSK